MDFRLAKEIYNQPWHMDHVSIAALTSTLKFHQDNDYNKDSPKSNQTSIIPLNENMLVRRPWQLLDLREGDTAVSLINLDGPITKHGGMSHAGTLQLAQRLRAFDENDKVKGHILAIESGGGSSIAVAEMAEAMQDVKKPIVVWADGLMASAALGIGSNADFIFAHRGTDKIGSIGTMIEFSGFPKSSEDKQTGKRTIRVYATKSTDKNGNFEEAINDLNFKPIIENVLDPVNERFISDMKKNRPNVKESQLTGEIFDASEVVGTLIDEIGTLEDAVNKVLDLGENSSSVNNNSNLNQNLMDLQKLKQEHPDLYNQVVESAASGERDRVQAYMEFADVDLESVKKGIESGKNPSQTFYAEMTRKAISKAQLTDTEEETSKEVSTGEEKKPKAKTDKEVKNFEKEVMLSAGLKNEEV